MWRRIAIVAGIFGVSMAASAWLADQLLDGAASPEAPETDTGKVDEQTLGDPPARGEPNPHRLNALSAAGLAKVPAGAERLHRLGLEKSEGDAQAGYWDFAECVAFFPDYPPCHRELGTVAYHQGDAPRAVREYTEYLRLLPGAEDRHDVQRLLGELQGQEQRVPVAVNPCKDDEAQIKFYTNHPGCTLTLDSRELNVRGDPLPVARCLAAGRAVATATCTDGATVRAEVEVVAGFGELVELVPAAPH
jgi:hypothetical protein